MRRILYTLFLILCPLMLNAQVLLIYGYDSYEDNYGVYLGKLNASCYDSESIWNIYGDYGNIYSSESIWNQYGDYGNEYSSVSPFNSYASNPPILLDNRGNYYGYFTSNKYKVNRCNLKLIDIICEYYEDIREDVSEWYDRIFE